MTAINFLINMFNKNYRPLAQLVERRILVPTVGSSNLSGPAIIMNADVTQW